jgi:hypothetical protein
MIEPLISIVLHGSQRVLMPGDRLTGEVQIDAAPPQDIQAVEVSVMWRTEGKGDEDLGVHYFERQTSAGELRGRLHELRTFVTTLPASPLTYDGRIVKIRWCARVRLFLSDGREYLFDQPFQLGNVPGPAPEKSASDSPAEAPVEAAEDLM